MPGKRGWEEGRERAREGASERWRQKGKGGAEERRIRNVERMSVAGETKDGRLCTAFCFAESAAEHGERRGQRVTKNNHIPPSPLEALSDAKQQVGIFFRVFVTAANISSLLFYLLLNQTTNKYAQTVRCCTSKYRRTPCSNSR